MNRASNIFVYFGFFRETLTVITILVITLSFCFCFFEIGGLERLRRTVSQEGELEIRISSCLSWRLFVFCFDFKEQVSISRTIIAEISQFVNAKFWLQLAKIAYSVLWILKNPEIPENIS